MSNFDTKQIVKLQFENTKNNIIKCNTYTTQFELSLSKTDVEILVKSQNEILKYNGMIQIGESILPKLIFEFCDSQYISQIEYLDVLNELQEIFYYFKNESLDELTDDELIQSMKKYYENECQGSLEYLKSTFLEKMCEDTRFGIDLYDRRREN